MVTFVYLLKRTVVLGKKKKYDRLTNYMEGYEVDLKQSIKIMKTGIDKEDLHRFRVSVKKLRAICRLLNLVSPKKLKFASTVSSIYSAAGHIREAQVNSHIAPEFIESEKTNDIYSQYLNGLIDKNKRFLKKEIKRLDKEKYKSRWNLLYSVLKELSEDELIALVYQYINKELDAIAAIDPESDEIEDIHQIRKHVKGIYFIIKLLIDLEIELFTKNELSEIKQFSDVLGDWHDREVVYESMMRFKDLMFRCAKYETVAEILQGMTRIEEKNKLFMSDLRSRIEAFNELLCGVRRV